MKDKKYIIVTGGVISGLGKGIAIASIGNLLSNRYKCVPIKCDGYLNVDPGTMNPIEHGEVFVLDDGGEVDMDFGHYERFLGVDCKFDWNLTMGKVYQKVREKERKGDYLGKTVQLIPHVSDTIREHWIDTGIESEADVVLIEIGGTVGDMENELYIEAARTLPSIVGRENVIFVHLTYVPVPFGVDEQKSKPTQQSVGMLRQRGIEPDLILARCTEMLSEHVRNKISLFANLEPEAVISAVDVDDIYKVPIVYEEQGISELITKKLGLYVNSDTSNWKKLIENKLSPKSSVKIAICGKYTALQDSYASIVEALNHCSANLSARVEIVWLDTEEVENLDSALAKVNGVIVPGGFGSRGIEGKIKTIEICRTKNIPFLGICYGLQTAVIEFARNVCGLNDANTAEIDVNSKNLVVDILEEQKDVVNKGGTMRLGAYKALISKDSKISSLYGCEEVFERHRHRFEVNPKFHKILEEKGLIFSGMSPNGSLVEFLELSNHPYFVATQAHPELKSSLVKPAPMFMGLIKAAMKKEIKIKIKE